MAPRHSRAGGFGDRLHLLGQRLSTTGGGLSADPVDRPRLVLRTDRGDARQSQACGSRQERFPGGNLPGPSAYALDLHSRGRQQCARFLALRVGDDQPLREFPARRLGCVDAHLGDSEVLRIRGRVEDRALRARNEEDVLVRAHARRHRPHDVVGVEDVDVVVHHDDVLGVELGAERSHDRDLRFAVGNLLHRDIGGEGAAAGVRDVHRAHVRQVAPERVEHLALARDARDENVVLRHAGGDTLEHRVAPHAHAVRHEHVLRAAVGRIACELAERALGLARLRQDLALDHDLGAGGHLELAHAAARHAVGFAEQAADDLELPHLRRIGVDHRAHIVQRMRADGDGGGQRLAALLGAALELVHAAARMQRQAEAIFALEHQPVKARSVDAGHGIARGNLPGGDIGAAVDLELQRDRQLGEVDRVALDHHLVPGCIGDPLARNVFLAALAECGRQLLRRHPEAGRQELAVRRHVGDDRHAACTAIAGWMLEDDDGTLADPFQLVRDRGHVERGVNGRLDPQQLLGMLRLHHGQEAAQALLVDIGRGCGHGLLDLSRTVAW